MRLGKPGWVRNETLGIGSATIEAEVVNLDHSLTTNTGSQMLLSLTPGLKRRSTQVRILGCFLVEESVQGFEGVSCLVKTLA
jgi:hypothetical protein